LAGAAALGGMAGTADVATAMSVAADVRLDIPGWVVPVVADPAADGRAAAIPAAHIPAVVIRVVVIRAGVTPAVTTASP
jgi:hypothetical protein